MHVLGKIVLPSILVPLLMLVGCESATDVGSAAPSGAVPAQVDRVISDDGILKFNTKSLNKGETLIITMPVPHPKEMAIRAPDKRWYYIQVENEGAGEMLMPGTQFAALTKLEFDTSQLEARYWSDGKAMRGKVFTQTGEYLIYMADNLETEPENTLSFASIIRYNDADTAK